MLSQQKLSLKSVEPTGKYIQSKKQAILGASVRPYMLVLDNNDVVILTDSALSSTCSSTLHIYNGSNLADCKVARDIPKKMENFMLCPNGDVTVNMNKRRVLINLYSLEIIKDVGDEINFFYFLGSFRRACPINDEQYIVGDTTDSLNHLKVYDSKSHAHVATLDLLSHLEEKIKDSDIVCAISLESGVVALTLYNQEIVLFQYNQNKLLKVMCLDFKSAKITPKYLYLFPFTNGRMLTQIHRAKDDKQIIQIWNASTGEKIGEPFDSVNLVHGLSLPDGSIIKCDQGGVFVVQEKLSPYTLQIDGIVKHIALLKNDRILIFTKLKESKDNEYDLQVIELENIFKAKRVHVEKEMMVSTSLDKDTTGIVTSYVGCDVIFPKTKSYPSMFFSASRAIIEKPKLSRDVEKLDHALLKGIVVSS